MTEQRLLFKIIEKTYKSLNTCYWKIKDSINKINSLTEDLDITKNVHEIINIIHDYWKLCLILFEKLVIWKEKNEMCSNELFGVKQLYQLKLFVWGNKNLFRDVFLNYQNLQVLCDCDYITISNNDLFFLRIFFKVQEKTKILTFVND